MSRLSGHQSGFTLVELSIVLVIVALLMGGLLATLSSQRELAAIAETERRLESARDALIGSSASNKAEENGKPYLPCPDTDGDGLENRNGTGCSKNSGDLPFGTLGVAASDAWGRPFRYHVSPKYADSKAGFALDTNATLQVCEEADCKKILVNKAPAVILSLGKNGSLTPKQKDELLNVSNGERFVSHPPTADSFDDLVTWLSPYMLHYRMIAVGRLP